MDLFDKAEQVFTLLKNAQSLKNVTVIKAYPYADKPTRLNNTVIAVLPTKMNCETAGIGESAHYCEVEVTAAVFTPQKNGSEELMQAAEKAVKAVLALMPCKISLSPPQAKDMLNCLTCEAAFTFYCLAEDTEE